MNKYAYLLNELANYPKDMADAFKQAYTKAEQVNKDSEAMQAEADAAKNALVMAAQKLETYEEPNPDDPDKPDQPENPDQPNKPDQPNNPDKPDQPNNPDEPSKPDQGNNAFVKDDVTVETDVVLDDDIKLAVKLFDQEMLKQLGVEIKDKTFLKKYNFEKLIDIYFVNGKDERVEFNHPIQMVMSIKIEKEMLGKDLRVVYISDSGDVRFIPSWVENDTIKFKTTHNSYYAIVSTAATVPGESIKPNSPIKNTGTKTEQNGTAILWTMLLLVGSAVYVTRKRQENN